MEDPILNRSIEETRELASRWAQFHDFFRMGKTGDNLTPQAEMKFLEVKMRVAMLHGGFMQAVRHDQKTAQNLISIMGSCTRLTRIKGMNPNEIQKIEYDWNEAYLLISETLSQLEEERDNLLHVNERMHKLQQFFSGAGRRSSASFGIRLSWSRRSVLLVAGLLAVPMLGLYDITRLKTDLPWTARFYDPTMRVVRLVYPEIPFTGMSEIHIPNPDFVKRARGEQASLFGAPSEVTSQIINRGWAEGDIGEVLRILQRNKGFNSKIYEAPGGRRLLVHEVLLATPEDAQEAVKLRRDNMDTNLSQEFLQTINASMTVCRRANFVVIFELATSDFREEAARKMYGFRTREIGL
jgi:hypothetical protein